MSAYDSMPLSGESIEWLQRLAREHEAGIPWVSFEDVAVPEAFRPLIWLKLVEQDDISFRLTDFGYWALGNVVENADA